MKLQLLNDIYKQNPALKPENQDLSLLLSRSQNATREQIAKFYVGKETMAHFQFMMQLNGMTQSGSSNLVALTRSLISQPTLSNIVKAGGKSAGPALDLLGNLHFERSYPLIVDIANGKTSLRSDAIELLLNRSDLESAQVASSALRDFAVGASPQARQHFVHNLIQLIRDSDVGPNKVDNAILNARITAAESLISQVPATQRDAYMTYLLELIQNKRRLQG